MSKGDLSIIDTNKWKPVQSPGLKAPRHQLPYDSPEVQRVLAASFGSMFPEIAEPSKGVKKYQIINKSGVDIFPRAKPAKNITDIPRAEMLRLMEGWIRLRRKLQEEEIPSKVGGILLNFRVPNPRESLNRYMLYKEGDEQRLVIRWGYETKDDKAVSLERAISILMDVPLGHMRSILSTSMTPTTTTVPVGQMLASVQAGEGGGQPSKKGNKSMLAIGGAAASMLVLGGALVANGMKSEPEVKYVSIPALEESTAPSDDVEAIEAVEELAEEIVLEEPVVETPVEEPVVVKVPAVVVEVEPSVDELLGGAAIAEEKPEEELSIEAMTGSKNNADGLSLDAMTGKKTAAETDLLGEMVK